MAAAAASAAERRLDRIAAQSATAQPDRRKLSVLLNGANTKYRDELFDFVRRDPVFRFNYNLPKESLRIITRTRLLNLVKAGFVIVRGGDEEDGERYDQYGDAISYIDNSMSTLIGAQFVLFCGSILQLGTAFHHEKFLKRASTMDLRGCFAMTELAHGSNVRGLETTATYDPARDEFDIHTPSESAQKYWIGGGYESAQMATVFAQLYVGGVHYGVHAFLVPLRSEDSHKILPGVRIKDCGHKMGLNGIDNGRFWFDHVRIPREYLLNRYGNVTREGEYESPIPDNDMRFAASLANLVYGRVGILSGTTNSAKIGLATAIHYGFTRRQFGPPGQPETPIIQYQTHQFRLMPLLATTYAHALVVRPIWSMFTTARRAGDMDAIKDAHVIISGLKAVASWHSSDTLQTCREACGGMGFKSSSRIGILKADGDISSTYEGDNFVLLQQLSRDLVRRSYPKLGQLRGDQELRNRADAAFIRDADAQLRLFELREADLVARLAERIQAGKDQGLTSAEVLGRCSIEAAEAGRAHVERFLLANFVEVERNARDASVAAPLALLRSLYALHRMDQGPSFLRGQYLAPEKARRVQQEVLLVSVGRGQLCGQLQTIALELVDAFAIPSFLLGDIAGDWINVNRYDNEDPA